MRGSAYPSLTASQSGYGTYAPLNVNYKVQQTDNELTIPTNIWNLISPLRPTWTATGLNTAMVTINTNTAGTVPDLMLTTTGSFVTGGITLSVTQGGAPADILLIQNFRDGKTVQVTVAQGRAQMDLVSDLTINDVLTPVISRTCPRLHPISIQRCFALSIYRHARAALCH